MDLVNKFGVLGGFSILQERICEGSNLSVPLLAALLRFGINLLFFPCSYSTAHCAKSQLRKSETNTSTTIHVLHFLGQRMAFQQMG